MTVNRMEMTRQEQLQSFMEQAGRLVMLNARSLFAGFAIQAFGGSPLFAMEEAA